MTRPPVSARKDRPILFSAPMARALIEGRKTQTRRVLTMPDYDFDAVFCEEDGTWHIGDALSGRRIAKLPVRYRVGDRLWVRETWRTSASNDRLKPAHIKAGALISYDADYNHEPNDGCRGKTRVAIHMPRWASRLTLTVTDVRAQRLQEISEADCISEGAFVAEPRDHDHGQVFVRRDPAETWHSMTPRAWYHELWNSINGPGAWDENPWVVALTFTVDRRNIDAMGGHP